MRTHGRGRMQPHIRFLFCMRLHSEFCQNYGQTWDTVLRLLAMHRMADIMHNGWQDGRSNGDGTSGRTKVSSEVLRQCQRERHSASRSRVPRQTCSRGRRCHVVWRLQSLASVFGSIEYKIVVQMRYPSPVNPYENHMLIKKQPLLLLYLHWMHWTPPVPSTDLD